MTNNFQNQWAWRMTIRTMLGVLVILTVVFVIQGDYHNALIAVIVGPLSLLAFRWYGPKLFDK